MLKKIYVFNYLLDLFYVVEELRKPFTRYLQLAKNYIASDNNLQANQLKTIPHVIYRMFFSLLFTLLQCEIKTKETYYIIYYDLVNYRTPLLKRGYFRILARKMRQLLHTSKITPIARTSLNNSIAERLNSDF